MSGFFVSGFRQQVQRRRYRLMDRILVFQAGDGGFDSLYRYFSVYEDRNVFNIEEAFDFHIPQWLGRQLADHFGSDPEMLWVRLPPEPLTDRSQPGFVAQLAELPSLKRMRVGSNPTGTTSLNYPSADW